MNKNVLFAFLMVVVGSSTAYSQSPSVEQNLEYYTLQAPVVRQVKPRPLPSFKMSQDTNTMPLTLLSNSYIPMISDIVNIGSKVWDIVKDGKSVTEFESQSAHALPNGMNSWTMLSNWSEPVIRTYQVTYKNIYGMTVVDFTYSVIATTGGQYQQRGAYIANAMVIPNDLYVMWGFDFKANVEIPMVINKGTEEDPVAGMQINMMWTVGSLTSSVMHTELYFVDGRGNMKAMLSPNAPPMQK